jgi:hypothetical protein
LEAVLTDDQMLRDELGFTILADIGKAALAGLAGYLVGAALLATGVACLPLAGAIVVGIAVSAVLDHYFPTKEIAKAMEDYIDDLSRTYERWNYQIERNFIEMQFGGPF